MGESNANSIAEVPDWSLNWRDLSFNWCVLHHSIEIFLFLVLSMPFARRDIPEPIEEYNPWLLKGGLRHFGKVESTPGFFAQTENPVVKKRKPSPQFQLLFCRA
jgi:hypothetical protein